MRHPEGVLWTRGSRRLPRALIAFAFLALPFLAVSPSSRANSRLVIADAVSILMPSGFRHSVSRPLEGGEGGSAVTLFEVRDGPDTLVVVIYGGKSAPDAAQALELHTAELASSLGKAVRTRKELAGLVLFGAARPTEHLHLQNGGPNERLAWVVAAELPAKTRAGGSELTVVCSALYLPGSPNAAAFKRMAESLASATRKGAP